MSKITARSSSGAILKWYTSGGSGSGINIGSVVGTQVTITLTHLQIIYPYPIYAKVLMAVEEEDDGGITKSYRKQFSGYHTLYAGVKVADGAQVVATYLPTGVDANTAHEEVTLESLEFDLTRGYDETITYNSVRFTLGDTAYVQRAGVLYRDVSPQTGVGTPAGTLDPMTGRVRLTGWRAGGDNLVTVNACVTEIAGYPVDECVFRTPAAPLKPGTLQLRWLGCDGTVFSKTVDPTGVLEDNDCIIRVDYPRGMVRAHFGRWKTVADLTDADRLKPWYTEDSIVTRNGVPSIFATRPALADSIVYNAVAQTTLPPDSTLLGIDAARLPPDGKALIYRVGMLALVHHTAALAVSTLTAGQVIDCGRLRLYRVVIEDSQGRRLPADAYTVDRVLGLVTLADPLDQTGYTAPWTVRHTIADLGRVRDTDINGSITFMRALSHDYPADESLVSGVIYCGTLQARVSNVFAQATWSNVWADACIGSAPLAQYNDTLYPIAVTDVGTYPDRILVQFTSATDFRVIGEQLGIIAVGNINTTCAPSNPAAPIDPATGLRYPYFTLDNRGWGLGWAVGNCLRFNLHGACFPVDLVRAVQPSDPTGLTDQVELLLIGNVDA